MYTNRNRSLGRGLDVLIVVLTDFFVLMTGLDLVGAKSVEGFSAQVVLLSAIGLSVLLPIKLVSGWR